MSEQNTYNLIDSGNGLKLEKFGQYTLLRPDPQALWLSRIHIKEWHKLVDAEFSKDKKSNSFLVGDEKGAWKSKKEMPEKWVVDFGVIKMYSRLTPFKHTGIFPEQLENWVWLKDKIKNANRKMGKSGVTGDTGVGTGGVGGVREKSQIKMLNLFGYSGGATVLGLVEGAHVTHVDASKSAIKWAEQNAELNEVLDKPVRWILEDVLSFVKKEVRRGNKYDVIVLDPPSFGRGAKGEIWKIEEDFLTLIDLVKQLLSENPIALVVNGYAAGYSSYAYSQNLNDVVEKFGGKVEHHELLIKEEKTDRVLPAGIVARWSK